MVTVRIEGLEELEALARRLTDAVATIREAQALLGGATLAVAAPIRAAAQHPTEVVASSPAPVVMTATGPKRVEFTAAEFAQRTALKAQNFEEREETGFHDTKAASDG